MDVATTTGYVLQARQSSSKSDEESWLQCVLDSCPTTNGRISATGRRKDRFNEKCASRRPFKEDEPSSLNAIVVIGNG